MFECTSSEGSTVTQLRLSGRLDGITAPVFEKDLEKLLVDGKGRLILDCSQLSFMSSAGLRVLLTLAKKIKRLSGRMALYAVPPVIFGILQATGFVGFLTICETREAALQAVEAPPAAES